MLLLILYSSVYSVEVKEATQLQSTKTMRIPRTAEGILKLPWGNVSSGAFFYACQGKKAGDTFHVREV